MKHECWMWDTKENQCGGYDYNVCPENCKFKRSKDEQLRIEMIVHDHIRKDKPFLYNDFESMVGHDYLFISADAHNKKILKEEHHVK